MGGCLVIALPRNIFRVILWLIGCRRLSSTDYSWRGGFMNRTCPPESGLERVFDPFDALAVDRQHVKSAGRRLAVALQKNLGRDNQLALLVVRDAGSVALAAAATLPDFDKHQLPGWLRCSFTIKSISPSLQGKFHSTSCNPRCCTYASAMSGRYRYRARISRSRSTSGCWLALSARRGQAINAAWSRLYLPGNIQQSHAIQLRKLVLGIGVAKRKRIHLRHAVDWSIGADRIAYLSGLMSIQCGK